MGNRYELRTGKFGCYFYDTRNNESVSLQEGLDMMNGSVPLIDNGPIIKELQDMRGDICRHQYTATAITMDTVLRVIDEHIAKYKGPSNG